VSTRVSIGESPRADEHAPLIGVLVLSLFVVVPAVVVLTAFFAVNRGYPPTDEELTARFLSHEADFEALRRMITSDCARVQLGVKPCELADLMRVSGGTVRETGYERLLGRIGVTSFRYSLRSGDLVLPIARSGESRAGSEESLRYLDHEEPQAILRHQSHSWRGPGIYIVTGDRRIKGRWFIHHEGSVVIAFAPY
jgi:hypothetical protein